MTTKKAFWDKKSTKVLIDLCIIQVHKGTRKSTTFDKKGWKEIVETFTMNTGKTYDKSQLKNKYDSLRNQWQCWDRLLKETGVGWDYEKKTILADNNWWEKKIVEVNGYEKFRDEGLQFQEELTQLFSSVAATGPNHWAPSSNTLPIVVEPEYDIEEGSGDSDEVLGATTGLSADINSFNLSSQSGGSGGNTIKGKEKASSSQAKTSRGYRTTSSLGVRKRGDGKKKKMSASTKIADCLSRIADTNDTEAQLSSKMTSHAYDISVSGVMNHLNQLEEVVADEEFHAQCAILLMNNPPLREVYNSMKGMRKQLVGLLRRECARQQRL